MNDLSKSVSLVRSVRKTDVAKLAGIGITDYEQLAGAKPAYLKKTLGWTNNKANEVSIHARARVAGEALVKRPLEIPRDVPIHFWDIETSGSAVYLHGVVRLHEGRLEEKSFFATNLSNEGVVWRSFLEYLARDDDAIVYSWTDFERKFMFRLWDDYGGDKKGWKLLEGKLVDQCALIKKHFAFPVRTYSIKEVAPSLGFRWTTPGADGLIAGQWYNRWLMTGDEGLKNRIVQYNLDDARAMYVIHKELLHHAGVEENEGK